MDVKKKRKLKKSKKKVLFTSTELIIVSVIVGIISSSIVGLALINKNNPYGYQKISDNLLTIINTYNDIVDNYYEDVDKEKLVDGAIEGMLKSVDDPYTTYMDEASYNNFNITLNGSYKGLGLEVSVVDNELVIVGIFNNSPASKTGLQLGDIILSIDDLQMDNSSSSDFSLYVKNKTTDDFLLKIKRDGKEIDIKITKEIVTLKSVYSDIFTREDKKIGYIYVSIFAFNTYTQFKECLQELEKQNIDSLIIDLRSNSGGELNVATNIISMFLNNDKIMYQMQTKENIEKYYSHGTSDYDKPIAILVNSNSASASEVMTAALKENLDVKVVGKNTYGKGTVQKMLTTSTGEQYKITTSKWLTPNGNWINKKGIMPDIEVELSSEYSKNPITENDSQLQKAIDYLEEQ